MSAIEGSGKLPPDAIVLRPPPPPIVRFRRGLIIGLAGTASAGLCAVTYLAFRPTHGPAQNHVEAAAPVHPGETVLNAPASYDTLPKLVVPPSLGMTDTAPVARSAAVTNDRNDPATQQRRAARTAPVLVSLTHGVEPALAAPAPLPSAPASLDASTDEAQRKTDFAFATATGRAVDPHRLTPPADRWLLSAGSVISASLITGVDSDLPGEITAQVTDRVFDSVTGEILLIPQGARLIGRTDNKVSYGQSRVLIAWQRLILPDGSSMEIDSLPAGDAAGFAGLTDSVDHHEGRLAKGLALSTLVDVGSQLSIGSGSGSLPRAFRQSLQQGGSDVASAFAMRNLDIQPTIRVRPGWPVTVMVREDLLLTPWSRP